MNTRLTPLHALIALALVVVAGLWASAGPLDPPVGPIIPTNKTLLEVEPRIAINSTNTPGDADSVYKITSRGSYYLTGPVKGASGKAGIEIAASDVSIDLNGFMVIGVPGALGGITASSLQDNIDIRNGSVRDWPSDGIFLALTGRNSRITDVSAALNAGRGISVGDSAVVTGCTAVQNGDTGISVNIGGSVRNCTAKLNLGNGILSGQSSNISSCSAISNSANGIFASGTNCVVNACTAGANSLSGIRTIGGATVTGCSASLNLRNGFELDNGCTIVNCTSTDNDFDGIIAASRCIIRDNDCSVNGNGTRSNLHVTGAGNRIEGNNCTSAFVGIDIDGTANLIVRNSCRGNTTNYSIVAANTIGGIIAAGTTGAAINGSSAAGTIGTTDPWSNISY